MSLVSMSLFGGLHSNFTQGPSSERTGPSKTYIIFQHKHCKSDAQMPQTTGVYAK